MPENSNHTRICWIVPEQPAQEDPDARLQDRSCPGAQRKRDMRLFGTGRLFITASRTQ